MEGAPPQSGQKREPGSGALITGGCYTVLLLLGIAQSVLGSFHYSRGIGSFPAAAIGFALLILLTCVLAAWGMRTPGAALMPAVGWFAASFLLAMSTPGGSIVITNTTAGKWFLFGGAASAAAGVIVGFTTWSPGRTGRQSGKQQSGKQHGSDQHGSNTNRQAGARPRKPGL